MYIVRSILYTYLILKQLVSCGESRPGPPNPSLLFRPGILGPEYPKKRALSHFGDSAGETGQRRRKKQPFTENASKTKKQQGN